MNRRREKSRHTLEKNVWKPEISVGERVDAELKT